MKFLPVFNIKGGVGKTAAAVNLSYLAARSGLRVLLWDIDAQGAATFYFRIKPKVRGGGEKLILGKSNVALAIRGSDYEGLDVLPADFSYRNMAGVLATADTRRKHIRNLLTSVEDEYDLCIVDCAPNLNEVSDHVFEAADTLLVPTIPTTLSLRTLAQLMKYLKKSERRPMTLPFFSMVDRRKALHRRVCEYVRHEKLGFLASEIPYASEVEKMGVQRRPLLDYSPTNLASLAYEALWKETWLRLGGGQDDERALRKSTRRKLERAISNQLEDND